MTWAKEADMMVSLSSALLAVEIPDNPDLGGKILLMFGSAALGKISLTVLILVGLGFGAFYLMKK
jgi:hypothetical protein